MKNLVAKHNLALLAIAVLPLLWLSCFPKLHTRGPSVEVKETAPDFTLTDHRGNEVSLDSLLEKGPAVLVFYRGYW